jgi:hypothetical protein
MDRTDLSLSSGKWGIAGQDDLVAAVARKAGSKTLVLARCSGAFAMPWLANVAAVLYQLMPGQAVRRRVLACVSLQVFLADFSTEISES